MPTHETEGNSAGVGAAAKQVAEHASSLARLELQLAAVELKSKLASFGKGLGLLVGAGVIALFALGFLLAAAAAGLETFLPDWGSLLIVAGVLLMLVVVLGLLGVKAVSRGTPPTPEQAITEAKRTTEALKK